MKPYGFKVITDEGEREFKFTRRDWSILTSFDGFSKVSGFFKRLIGMDSLEFQIGQKKYSIYVTRTKRFFMQQLSGVQRCFIIEKEDLCTDFSVATHGYGASKSVRFQYMGYSADTWCSPGLCTLRAYDMEYAGGVREIIKIDLRRYNEFLVDGECKIKIKRKKRESEIEETLNELSKYVESNVVSEILKIELIGGDH
ncbi:MAG: hypothetical protein KGO49_08700 [Gammaproteobacteria bacterium]|nr:hypothetical protein [Gammaproteobacteria bacterium]